jgi:predicted DNA binding CopG/RHH family protein
MANLKKKRDRLERKITFRIDENRLEELENFAAFEGMPVSFVVRHLVIRFLEDRKRSNFLAKQNYGLESRL